MHPCRKHTNVLGLSWDEYWPVVQRIADQMAEDNRAAGIPAVKTVDGQYDPEYPPCPTATAPNESEASFHRDFTKFAHWLATKAKEPFQQLLNILRPRAPRQAGRRRQVTRMCHKPTGFKKHSGRKPDRSKRSSAQIAGKSTVQAAISPISNAPPENLAAQNQIGDFLALAVHDPKGLLRWSVDTDRVSLYSSTVAASTCEQVNWPSIEERADAVPSSDSTTFVIEETTAFYLLARTDGELFARRVVVHVRSDSDDEAHSWSPLESHHDAMSEKNVVIWRPEPAAEMLTPVSWHAGPSVSLSASRVVAFDNESVRFSWDVRNASCAQRTFGASHTRLAPDTSQNSGTAVVGGWTMQSFAPPCQKVGSGSDTITHASPQIYGQTIWAENPSGPLIRGAHAYFVRSPAFRGNYSTRVNAIRHAIRDIVTRLKRGCIVNDKSLDTSVPAFRDKRLDRRAFYSRLLAEFENLHLLTFECVDFAKDSDNYYGRFTDRSNTIQLGWSPNRQPYLPYVILHELCHKAGFHSSLLPYYSRASIENQTHQVSGICYP